MVLFLLEEHTPFQKKEMKRAREDAAIQPTATCTRKDRLLDRLNAHARDSRIHFDAGPHKYYVDWTGDQQSHATEGTLSVTGLVSEFFPAFDADQVITRMMASANWPKNKKYYGRTREDIKAEWSSSGTSAGGRGTEMHAFIEDFYQGERTLEEAPVDTVELRHFRLLHTDILSHLVPYRAEMLL